MKMKTTLLNIFFILILPSIVALCIFIIRYRPSELIEYSNSNYSFCTYSDEGSGGKSTIALQVINKDRIEAIYTLSDYLSFPNVSLSFNKFDYSLIDFSDYDYITINVDSEKSKFLLLQFNIFIEGYSNSKNYETYLPIGYYLELNRADNKYKIPLKLFKPHTWWLSTYQVSEDIIENYSFDSVVSMEIMNDPSFSTEVEDKIILRNVEFHTDINKVFFTIITILTTYYLTYLTLVFIKRRIEKVKQNREKIIIVPYQTTYLKPRDSDESKIENFICSNYSDPLLNIAKVVDATNISERIISKVLKNKYDYSFPGFINFLRISEAKKLLETSDNKILDIAMIVGYNSLGHFNRTFKSIEKITPREYRKEKKIIYLQK